MKHSENVRLRPRTIALSLAAIALPLAALWLVQGPQLERSITSFPVLALLGAAAAHLGWLGVRSEAWRLSLNAVERPIPRHAAHGASAAGYVIGTVQSASGLPVRAMSLRRMAPHAPTIDRTIVAEAPVIAIEAALIALVFTLAVASAPVAPAWGAIAAVVVCVLAVALLAFLARRFSHRRAVAGLRVLADPRRRGPLVAAVGLMTGLGMLRAWVVLLGSGLPHGLASVVILFAAMGLLGALPLGPGASPGAMLAVFGPVDAGAAAGAGIAMVGTSIVAVLAYSLLAGLVVAAVRGRSLPAPDAVAAGR